MENGDFPQQVILQHFQPCINAVECLEFNYLKPIRPCTVENPINPDVKLTTGLNCSTHAIMLTIYQINRYNRTFIHIVKFLWSKPKILFAKCGTWCHLQIDSIKSLR